MGRNIPDTRRSIQQAFTAPPTGQQGDFRRDALRGFGAWQADVAFQRHFKLTEKVGLVSGESSSTSSTTRTLAPTNSLTRPLFGQSAQTLASSLDSTILFR
jgi:hypothetical protein